MAISYSGKVAIFEGVCKLNEAEALQQWLMKTPGGTLDFTDCRHLHTAILQQLLLARPAAIKPPDDAFMRCCLSHLQTS